MRSAIHSRGRFVAIAALFAACLPALAAPQPVAAPEYTPDESEPRRAWNALRHGLANNDTVAVQAALAEDAEIYDLDAAGARLRARGPAAVAALLARDTGADAGVGVALLPTRSFRVDETVYAAETLPRVPAAPARLSIYRTYAGRVLRIWRFPVVPRSVPSALDDVIAYREAWSTGRWSEVAAHHAQDVQFWRLGGATLSTLSTLPERRRCYDSGFRRWRTLNAGPQYHPQLAGCDGGPIAVERGVGVGPYVATVEKRLWAAGVNEWSLRLFLYVADDTGIRRVIYVLAW